VTGDQIVMWEMRIIQEFCELGSLTHVLSKGVLPGQSAPRTPPDIKAALYIAKDVACGMLHIHSMQVRAQGVGSCMWRHYRGYELCAACQHF
jgi:hypothetical protein